MMKEHSDWSCLTGVVLVAASFILFVLGGLSVKQLILITWNKKNNNNLISEVLTTNSTINATDMVVIFHFDSKRIALRQDYHR